jgi:predicted nucleic acid-binding protein
VRQVLFDTSVYIDALRRRDPSAMRARGVVAGERLWLSAVVLEELLAGATGPATKLVEGLGRDFDKVGRLLVPNAADWAAAGTVLAKIVAAHGFEAIGRARMTNDALIAMSAARTAVTVVTRNARDFARLAEVRPDFTWRLLS